MHNFLKNTFLFAILVLSGTSFASADHPVDENAPESLGTDHEIRTTEEKEFEAAEHAIHHVLDAHDIHIADGLVLALPVILWTENGMVTFMSSEFHHDDEGHHIVPKNGMNFVKIHEKIYQLNAGDDHVLFDGQHHPMNATAVTDLSITKNVVTLFVVAALLLFIFIRAAKQYKSGLPIAPKGIAKWTEPGIVFVQTIAKENIEAPKYQKFTPYLLTVFFFIFFGNLLGLIPFIGSPNMTGNISITILLAAFTFVIQMVNSKKTYWMHIVDPLGHSLPWYGKVPLYIILLPIEIAGIFIKPVALLIRLFANITAGHIIVVSLIAIIFVNKNVGWAGLSVPMTLFISVLELLVAFLQAYIFTMLSAMYIGSAVESKHH